MKQLPRFVIIGLLLCLIGIAAAFSLNNNPKTGAPSSEVSATTVASADKAGEISVSRLPKEAQQTLQLIKKGGPFPYDRDGIVFGNFEKVLPKQARGYYHEYTVVTPGAKNRGARRIISGMSGEYYYTDDHYRSFSKVKEGAKP